MTKRLVRDAVKVTNAMTELPNGQLVCNQPCRIQIPYRFAQRGLAQVSVENYIYGIYVLILDDGTYAVSNINAMVKIKPEKILTTTINDVLYYEFHFSENSVVIDSMSVVKRDAIIYNVFDEFIFKGNLPWYIEYDDLGKLFDTAKDSAGSQVGKNLAVIELIASMIARSKNERTKYYRATINDRSEIKINPPVFVPLNNVFYSATNTLSKVAGSYFTDGVTSALVNPCSETEKIEALIKA